MHRWIVIGLLRDGIARSEDDIARLYRERAGLAPDRTALRDELAGLAAQRVLEIVATEGAEHPAYRLGADGSAAFDGWLTAPEALDGLDGDDRMTSRLLRLGEMAPAEAMGLLGRWEAELWERARTLERARAAADVTASAHGIAAGSALLDRLLEHVAADIATLAELRSAWDAWRAPARTP